MTYAELERLFAEKRITRRQFLQGAAALGAVSMAPGMFAGAAHAAEPKQGGRVRIGLGHGSSGDSLDPATFQNDFTIDMCYGHHNHLVEINADSEILPELAEDWQTENGKTWVIKLRKGVEFHNGKEMKADDVIASFRHHMGEDSTSAAKSLLDPVQDIRKDDDYTVVFELEAPNVDFLYLASDYHIAIKPAVKDGRIDPTDGIGAGPFRIEEFRPGERAHLVRFENYWKEGLPYFDEVEMRVIHDQSSRTNALLGDEVDIIDAVDLATADRLDGAPNTRIQQVAGYQHYTFAMRTDKSPYDNNHIRSALKLAIDRQQVVDTVLRGYGEVGNDHPISPRNRFHAGDLEQQQLDPEKARWHLKKADAEGLKVKLHASSAAYVGSVEAAQLYQETAKQAGIDLQVVRAPSDGYWSDVWMNEKFCAVYWGGRVSEDWMFSTTYVADANWNDTFWKNERFNKLVKEARATLDEDKRADMYRECQKILRDDGGALIPMFADFVHGLRNRVQAPDKVAGMWRLDGHKWFERWWLA